MDAKTRKLKSEDNQIFEIEVESLKLSNFLNNLIIDFPDEEDEILISQVDGKNLKLIIDFLNHYQNQKVEKIPKPLPSGDLKLYLDEWDYNYINPLSLEECIDLLNAAQTLDIEEIINLASAKIASEMLIGTVNEVLEKFRIKEDKKEEVKEDKKEEEKEDKKEEEKEYKKEDEKEEDKKEDKKEDKEEEEKKNNLEDKKEDKKEDIKDEKKEEKKE